MLQTADSPSKLDRIEKWLPGVRALRNYQRSWLPRDLVAGLVLCTLLVPQGMAYAELAGLPAITGLYTTVVCLVAYATFGPSPYLVLGPDSSLGPMIAAIILPLAAGDVEYAIALAGIGVDGRLDQRGCRAGKTGLCCRSDLKTGARRLSGRFSHHHLYRSTA